MRGAGLDRNCCEGGIDIASDPIEALAEVVVIVFLQIGNAVVQLLVEDHKLAQMFWEKFVRRVYAFLGDYIRQRQRDGAMIQIEPLVIVRAFVGMVIHHSLNNNLWDRKRTLLKISNQAAAREFTAILLRGVTTTTRRNDMAKKATGKKAKKTRR